MLDRPFFASDNPRNITALTGETVTLKCTVKNRGNQTVRQISNELNEITFFEWTGGIF